MSFDNGPVHAAGETEIIRIYDQTTHGASLAGGGGAADPLLALSR
jgi:hypothetical protein